MSDKCAGPQSKIPGGSYRVTMDKNLEKSVRNLGGGFNKKSGTSSTKFSESWSGTTKGSTKHTFKGK